ncbi:hypothetical protein GCM10011418_33370 [Sphingobacterium alkalisoli]|nr:hypothetical protein GCM10011418_33370 [Sphingobacterium alkalisoli]
MPGKEGLKNAKTTTKNINKIGKNDFFPDKLITYYNYLKQKYIFINKFKYNTLFFLKILKKHQNNSKTNTETQNSSTTLKQMRPYITTYIFIYT